MFGAASTAYLIEGGWNSDNKGMGLWDYLTHTNSTFFGHGSNGNIASDTYHKYKEDVKILNDLGVNFYMFSLSWERILPAGSYLILCEMILT